MDSYTLISIIVTLAVIFGYLNHRFIKMQPTIAIMTGSLILSLLLQFSSYFGFTNLEARTESLLMQTDFRSLLLNGLLSFLLFAGALTINTATLRKYRWEIIALATFSTIFSTIAVGICSYYILAALSLNIPFIYCLLFGALISPTDPIAVLSTFKKLGAPKDISACVAGESLFNDGVGIVIFTVLLQLALTQDSVTPLLVSKLFLTKAVGGMIFGAILGYLARWLIKPVQETKIIILVTLAIVTGGYHLAEFIQVSGPLAMVVAGLLTASCLENKKQQHSNALKEFWEIIDEILNAILFLLIGFELLLIKFTANQWLCIILVLSAILIIRFISVSIPIALFRQKRRYSKHFIKTLTWGGLRGGLAVALALTLPPSDIRDQILVLTYSAVAFAVIVQGLSIKTLIKRI